MTKETPQRPLKVRAQRVRYSWVKWDFRGEHKWVCESCGDVWSWLPSKKVAERHHGEYACEVQPSVADILGEAAMVMAEQAGSKLGAAERAEWFERCPCGEEHPAEAAEAAPSAKKRTAARTPKARKART